MSKGYITIKKNMDCMHRIVHHASKCKHVHGHSFLYELTFSYEEQNDLGYAIDFSEIKRVGVQFLEDYLDHGAILNPEDKQVIELCKAVNSKYWLMSLNGKGEFCNPSVENIAKEVFLIMEVLFEKRKPYLYPHRVRIYETPNCFTDCYADSIQVRETDAFYQQNRELITKYREEKGVVEYDSRNL